MTRDQIQRRREAIRTNFKLGWTYEELSRRFHLQVGTIYEICQLPKKERRKQYLQKRKIESVSGRNREIHDRYERGESSTELGQFYGLTRQRICKIVQEVKKYDKHHGVPVVPSALSQEPQPQEKPHENGTGVQRSPPADGILPPV